MSRPNASPFSYVGGHPLVDLVNTLVRVKGKPFDLLGDFGDARRWAVGAGLVPEGVVLHEEGRGERALREFRGFRKQMRVMLGEIVRDGRASVESLDAINRRLRQTKRRSVVVEAGGGGYRIVEDYPFSTKACLPSVLAGVAADFLVQCDHRRLKPCGSGSCVRYFLDTTKNGSRRWCSMETCGNRVKAKRHYQSRRTREGR